MHIFIATKASSTSPPWLRLLRTLFYKPRSSVELLLRNMIYLLILFALVLSCFELVRTRYRRGLAAIPGPFIASISNIWKVSAVYHGDMPRRNVAVHEKYGSVVRIGPKTVSFASPEAFHTIHGSRQAYAKVCVTWITQRCLLAGLIS